MSQSTVAPSVNALPYAVERDCVVANGTSVFVLN